MTAPVPTLRVLLRRTQASRITPADVSVRGEARARSWGSAVDRRCWAGGARRSAACWLAVSLRVGP